MPAIADQVATIEHDLAVALANLDSVKSEAAQLKQALSALQTEHIALQGRHMEAVALFDETRQHAQAVATAALTMLKVSRPQAGAAPVSEGTKALQSLTISPEAKIPLPLQAQINAKVAEAIEPEKTDVRPELPIIDQGQQETTVEPVQGDSGDEHQPIDFSNVPDPADVAARLKTARENIARTVAAIRSVPIAANSGDENQPAPKPVSVEEKQAAINAAHAALHAAELLPLLEDQDAGNANALASEAPEVLQFKPVAISSDVTNTDRLRAHMTEAKDDPLPIFLQPRNLPAGVPPGNVLG
ncbi:hypothetical protein ACRQ5Q_24460 [Bradyrhizobium sp. PMVTL-01]|uniref:hypothetical protein n=1 Tax=Bradyrhizobium sp. PMVTL-01 TaxID=3434999 RepID=UPI003F6EFD21